MQTHQLLRRGAVEKLTGLSRATIYVRMAEGEFPRPIRIGAQAVAWKESDIEAWIESRELAGSEPRAAAG